MSDRALSSKRLFGAAVAAWGLGKPVSLKVRVTCEQMHATNEALMATRVFNEELMREGATVDSVMEKLEAKRAASDEFFRVCDMVWPL